MVATYSKSFYRSLGSVGEKSAREILPFVLDLFHPQSIVDVGCGSGDWLAVSKERGVDDITGIDFHNGSVLNIPKENFHTRDLTRPIRLERTFDLAISLEVGEHLPAEVATTFVESLTQLAPIVLFSAAIPSQAGTSHINEQWPMYWANIFERFNFAPVDCIRPKFWNHSEIACYYIQNTVLYVRRDELSKYPALALLPTFSLLRLVHPGMFEDQAKELRQLRPLFSTRGLVKRLPGALWLSIAERVKRVLDR